MQQAVLEKRPLLPRLPLIIPLMVIWHLVVIGASVYVASWLARMSITEFNERYSNIGPAVQDFMTLVLLLPAVLGAFSSVQGVRLHPSGRYAAVALNFVGMVLAAAYLMHLWGVYTGIDEFADGVVVNAGWLVGIAVAYALFWLAGRLDSESAAALWLERLGLGLAMLALMGLLWFAGAAEAAVSILETYAALETWLVTAALLIFGVVFVIMLYHGPTFGETTQQKNAWQGWLMLSPNIIGFALFFAGPLLLSFYLSFTNASVGQVPSFTGLENYGDILGLQVEVLADGQNPREVLWFGYGELTRLSIGDRTYLVGASDPLFWISLRNTLIFCLLLVPISTIPALLLAVILNSKIPGMTFFRAVYFLPSVAAVVGTSLIWRWLYDPTIGYFNYFISGGVDFLNSVGIGATDPEPAWLTTSGLALFSVVLLAAWQLTGFNTVIFLAGLQGIPRELYEAAYVDGAGRVRQFFSMTLPLLAPTAFFVIITTIITGLQVFNEIYTLFFVRPLPEHVTTSVYYLYNRGFFRFEFGYASSIAWLLFALIFTVTLVQFRLSRSSAYED
ncbi:MAG: sugar ABC transporter permease [Anaerolineae bacterium]|nr:sugar ABC transporter permease [Anaerolineae bacterium]